MLGVSAAGHSIVVPAMARTSGAPPWWLPLRLPNQILFVMWGAAALGAIGVGAGLIAVARGARPPTRPLLIASFVVVAAFAVLPPAGSTDAQSYAIDGNMLVVGRSPYVDTPAQMAALGDRLDDNSPPTWKNSLSDYGPIATAEEWVSAELGGSSMAGITFWLKLWIELAFVAVTLLLDRVLRADPAQRLRAHLLWSLNPLVLWEIVAVGHIDGLAIALGLGGMLLITRMPRGGTPRDRRAAVLKAAGAGALIGLAAAVKAPYALFGIGGLWALRRYPGALAAGIASGLVVIASSYAAFGLVAITVLFHRGNQVTWDNLYQVFYRPLGFSNPPPHLVTLAIAACVIVGVLAFIRMPDRVPKYPAVTVTLALSTAWIFLWPFERPWYDVMIIALLALYPRSWLDWAVLARLCFGAITYMESALAPSHSLLQHIQLFQGEWITPPVRLLAAVAFIYMCVSGRWGFPGQSRLTEATPTLLQPQP